MDPPVHICHNDLPFCHDPDILSSRGNLTSKNTSFLQSNMALPNQEYIYELFYCGDLLPETMVTSEKVKQIIPFRNQSNFHQALAPHYTSVWKEYNTDSTFNSIYNYHLELWLQYRFLFIDTRPSAITTAVTTTRPLCGRSVHWQERRIRLARSTHRHL